MGGDARARDDNKIDRLSGSGRYAPRARPEGERAKKRRACTEGRENFPRLNAALSLGRFCDGGEKPAISVF